MSVKRSLFSLAVVAASMIMGVQQAKADVDYLTAEKHWVRLTELPQPEDWEKYYYVIVDKEKPLMLALANGVFQNGNFMTMWYQGAVDPYIDQTALWMFEKSNYSNSSQRYFQGIRNVADPEYVLCSKADNPASYRTGIATTAIDDYTRVAIHPVLEEGNFSYFYIGNAKSAGLNADHTVKRYLGPWSESVSPTNVPCYTETRFDNVEERRGRFVIYAILRSDYEAELDSRFSTQATPENPLNVSWLIKNRGFEMKSGTDVAAVTKFWTSEGSSNVKVEGNQETDKNNQIFRYKGTVGNLHQTIKNLPGGKYKLRVNAFFREGDFNNCYNLFKDAAEHHYGVVYAGENSTPIMSIYSYERKSIDLANGFITSEGVGGGYFVPDAAREVATAFHNGFFGPGTTNKYGEMKFNEVEFSVEEGDEITIGVKATNDVATSFLAADNFELWYCGSDAHGSEGPVIENVTADIENAAVKQYLNAAHFDFIGAKEYLTTAPAVADRPAAVSIPVASSVRKHIVFIGESEDYSDALSYAATPSGGAVECHFNGEPGVTYYYKVETSDHNVVKKGTLTISDGVRMIYTDRGCNIRDLGGYVTVDGKKVRYGRLFRGAEMHAGSFAILSPEDIMEMQRLGITAELDLRHTSNLATQTTTSAIPGAAYKFMNLAEPTSLLITDAQYRNMIKESIHFIAENLKNDGAVYFHCILGADRTGAWALFLESILGMRFQDIYHDYQLTSFSKAGLRPNSTSGMNLIDKIAAVQDARHSDGTPKYEGNTFQEKMVSFLKSCGVTDDDINTIREELLEETTASAEANVQFLNAQYDKFAQAAGITWDATATTPAGVAENLAQAIEDSSAEVFDLTSLVTNADFEATEKIEDWSYGKGDFGNSGTNENKVVRCLNTASSYVRKTLPDMPAGTYIVKCQGFDRKEENPSASGYQKYLNGTEPATNFLMANDVLVSLKSLYADARSTQFHGGAVQVADGVYVPTNTGSCAAVLMLEDRGLYWNEATCTLSESGDLTIGILINGSTPDYTVMDNFKLYYSKSSDVPTIIKRIEEEGGADAIYDISGRMVMNPQRGINIVNGKKVLMK